MANFLDKTGLDRFLSKIKSIFALKADTYTKNEVDTLVAEGGGGAGGIDIDLLVPITWAELKALRDNGQLVAGTQYRIIDYTCTTTQENTQSAGNVFDIIVTAYSESVLNENARAIAHEGDEYFATCNLNAWELKYCLDNDTTRFEWADTENGKGVVFYMKDEWRNECHYDFKNIQYKRWAITNVDSDKLSADAIDALRATYCIDQNGGKHFGNKDQYGSWIPLEDDNENYFEFDEEDFGWYYTFHGIKSSEYQGEILEHYDVSAKPLSLTQDVLDLLEEEGWGGVTMDECHDNTIGVSMMSYFINDVLYQGKITLNNIVFTNESYIIHYEEDGAWEWAFASCYSNTFGNDCDSNTFGNDCYSNTFGNSCDYNTFGNYCDYNTFGNDCYSNTFGNDCDYNTFGNSCDSNTFGNSCDSNTFGNDCDSNTFGNDCDSNTFGNDCYSNTFGNDCYSNTFGNSCDSNTFGNDYFCANTLGKDVKYCKTSYSTGSSKRLQYIQVANGTKGTNSSNKLSLSGLVVGAVYSQLAGFDKNGNYKVKVLLNTEATSGGSAINDVSIFAVEREMYIRAPKGMLTESDTPIFARYTKSKIRGSKNYEDSFYWVGSRTDYKKVNGWIRPICTNGNFGLYFGDDMHLRKVVFGNDVDGCEAWNDNKYDYFMLTSEGEGFIGWIDWARTDYFCEFRVHHKKLGIRIDRDGETIVDYLPFSIMEDENGLHFAKWQ